MDHDPLGLGLWLVLAWLLPLAAFAVQLFFGKHLGKAASYVAIGAIASGFVLSLIAFGIWGANTAWAGLSPREHGPEHEAVVEGHGEGVPAEDGTTEGRGDETHEEGHADVGPYTGTLYTLTAFGHLRLEINYYIDSLTLVMFLMVTLVASLIHIYSVGYMSDELTDDHVDHEVTTSDGHHLHRPGRFHRFFAFFSLFSFSMLGLVLAGNLFQVFIFWELVGLCSYLLIGFYFERQSASTAANKAFIVNRVGDFGMIVGLMVLWSALGTFNFPEIFDSLRGPVDAATGVRGEMAYDAEAQAVGLFDPQTGAPAIDPETGARQMLPYALLVVAGLGVFAGCVGKSAQYPLHVWLPDAMEGPTPVSALIHAATMVAAGVYLVGRFFPVFAPEVLLVIAYTGGVTLFISATIALVATDIKRVLAYSTVSQLGYMMLGLGVGGWAVGLFHLLTHAFFKALLFLCSGSVIHAVHTNEMTEMGGLRRKMPFTHLATLIGVIAITGLAIPGVIGFAGYYSKDAILAQAMAFGNFSGAHYVLFLLPLVGAGLTAFYMFRLYFMTFTGEPRDHHRFDHAHESPRVMWLPLMVLAAFSMGVAWGGERGPLYSLVAASDPTPDGWTGGLAASLNYPGRAEVHAAHDAAGTLAIALALGGGLLAYLFYGARILNADDVARQFASVYRFLVAKWRFDELYHAMLVRPVHRIAASCRAFDLKVIDGLVDASARLTVRASRFDGRFDLGIIDGLVNLVARWVYGIGDRLRVLQTGRLRQYVMFIVMATVGIFLVAWYAARIGAG